VASARFIDSILGLASELLRWQRLPSQLKGKRVQQEPLPDRFCSEAAALLARHAAERLHFLASEQFTGLLGTFTPREVVDLVSAAISGMTAEFQTLAWDDGLKECLVTAADRVRGHLLEITRALQALHAERVASSSAGTTPLDSRTLPLDAPEGTRHPTGKGNPLKRLEVFHEAAGALPEPHRGTWLLAHYLGLSTPDYERLTGDLTTFDASNRRARVLIQQALDRHDAALHTETDKESARPATESG
jgi:hypothetical protein